MVVNFQGLKTGIWRGRKKKGPGKFQKYSFQLEVLGACVPRLWFAISSVQPMKYPRINFNRTLVSLTNHMQEG
jgi:hypothetical protein